MSQRMFGTLFRDLRSLAVNNIEYFQHGSSGHHARFHQAFCILHEHLDRGIQPAIEQISPVLYKYDLSPDTQANGYRSLIRVIHKCCTHLLQLSRYINANRNSMFFRGSHYSKELDAYVTVLGQLRACIYFANRLVTYCDEGSLFANEESLNNAEAEHLMQEFEMLSQECFYGRCLGFQFCESMQKPLISVGVAMASFSEGYQETSNMLQFATSVLNSGKYIVNPELRAQQIVNVTRTAEVKFCKAFWSITETDFMQQMPSLVCPSVKVNEVISLQSISFDLPPEGTEETEMVTITPPCAHTGYGPVLCRLISHERREGQMYTAKSKHSHSNVLPKSSNLLIHCHGGGFVAQSSRSHEVYTRQWAKDLDVPILSIDYSLSPEQPFPRALEECFYVYAWAIKNADKLGWTGETVCFAGDSAGANLLISVALRAGSYGIKKPDGIVAIYPALMIQYAPSASRILGLMDPLLPIGILARCLAAYAGVADKIPSVSTPPEVKQPDIDTFVVYETKHSNSKNSSMPNFIKDSAVHGANKTEQSSRLTDDLASKQDDMTLTSKCHSVDDLSVDEYEYQMMEEDGYEMIEEDEYKTPLEERKDLNFVTPLEEVKDLPSEKICDKAELESESVARLVSQVSAETNDSGILSDTEQAKSDAAGENVLCNSQGSSVDNLITSPSHLPQNGAKLSPNGMTLNVKSPHAKKRKVGKFRRSPSLPEMNQSDTGYKGKFSPVLSSPTHIQYSPIATFRRLPITKNPYMSPLLAPDDMLRKLPPVHLVACHLDPLLDDAVMFAKRLRALDLPVDLHLVDDLPHGFLNFSTVSKEARLASDVCCNKILQVLQH